MNPYDADYEYSHHKKKHNHEREHTRKLINILRRNNIRAFRFPDDSNMSFPYDTYFVLHGKYYPGEFKYQDGGKKFSIAGWKSYQPDQYRQLYEDYLKGCKAYLGIFWKHDNRIELRLVKIGDIEEFTTHIILSEAYFAGYISDEDNLYNGFMKFFE